SFRLTWSIPPSRNPATSCHGGRFRHMFGPEAYDVLQFSAWVQPSTVTSRRRDGFFWFLFTANVLLFAALAVLVSAAVRRIYFPSTTAPPPTSAADAIVSHRG